MLKVPEEYELAEFFECNECDSIPEDGYRCYTISDSRGCRLTFSFNVFEQSIQTSIYFNSVLVQVTSCEGMSYFDIKKEDGREYLRGECNSTSFELSVRPVIVVRWYSLLNE